MTGALRAYIIKYHTVLEQKRGLETILLLALFVFRICRLDAAGEIWFDKSGGSAADMPAVADREMEIMPE